MSDEGSFMIDGWELIPWKTKTSGWVVSDKDLIHGAHPEDHFEKKTIIIAKSKIRRLYQTMKDEEENDE
ncbi:hypothetical protein [Sporolactobacillus terrae]|uniref:hypothetical protein n=1 Tax=Sporolactobacillus terrae TaxID=269673 RepID=UPI001CC1A583|nr:hypothetical protein [Sporolactobacillus terrae]UAK17582.1 hypothetical protein K7399_06555 [Sporolactobacillus terrae]